MEIGLFGGSFNPIHIGHLALANFLCEYAGIDELWFLVSPRNPLKADADLLPDDLRLRLVRVAIDGYAKFRASDFEFRRPRPSYMVDTLSALREAYPEHRFSLIIGSDNWALFPRWKDGPRIVAENRVIVYPRPGYPVEVDALPSHVRLVRAPMFDISSTSIRQALREGHDVRYLLHPAVYAGLMEYLQQASVL